jgi:heme A synthase
MEVILIALGIAFVLYALVIYFRKAEPTAHALWIVPLLAVVVLGLMYVGIYVLFLCCSLL